MLCVWELACICHMVHVEVRGQPLVLFEKLFLVYYWVHHTNWPASFCVSTSFLAVLGLKTHTITCSFLHGFWGLKLICSHFHRQCFTHWDTSSASNKGFSCALLPSMEKEDYNRRNWGKKSWVHINYLFELIEDTALDHTSKLYDVASWERTHFHSDWRGGLRVNHVTKNRK